MTTVGLFIILLGSIAALMAMQHSARCPDCRRKIREVYEDVHPRAAEYHLFYCEHCDVIWDSTIPKSSG